LEFQPPSTLKRVGKVTGQNSCGDAPSWITFGKNENERLAYVVDESEPGHIFTVSYANPDGDIIRLVGNVKGHPTRGGGSVAACVQDARLFVANYMSGSASVMTLAKDGLPLHQDPEYVYEFSRDGRGVGPIKTRQDKAYAHDVVASPDGVWVYVCDLGSDRIHRIRAATQQQKCDQTSYDSKQSTILPDGSGPRHLAFYRNRSDGRQFAYLSNELSCTVVAFEQHPDSGALEKIGSAVSALPEGVSPGGNENDGPAHLLAEVAVSKDGKFVYVSDRADPKEDYITIFKRSNVDGTLSIVKRVKCGGSMPRHFSLSPDDRYMAVANRFSNKVVILQRDPHTGDLTPTGAEIDMNEVVFAGFTPNS
jgi:6-phosphogluconolactonase